MEHLPKVVQSQLKKGFRVSAEPHPDANLLAAFSEQSLADSERTLVLTHISTCAECRDVVFLSTPEAATPAVQIRRVSSWRPIFAWSGAVACVLIVSGVAMLKHEKQTTNQTDVVAKVEAPTVMQQRIAQPEFNQPNTAQSNIATNNIERDQPLKKEAVKTTPLMAMQAKPAVKDFSNARDVSRASGAVSAPQSPVAEESKAPDENEVGAKTTLQLSSTQPVAEPSANSVQAVNGRQMANSGGPQSVSAQAAANNSPTQMRESFADATYSKGVINNLKFDNRSPRWTLNSDGTLLRSVDTGTSWKKIMIPGNAATLRTIATVGPDVWVGGTEGAVYHSNDSGSHWMPISLTYDGKPLSDDVISIKFVSPQQGAILTDRQAVWTTNDGGLTWNKK